MTLDRAHLTEASRIMLPTYAGLYTAIGLTFLLQSPLRTSGPAFETAKALLSIHLWGILFLVLGVLSAVAYRLIRSRRLYQVVLSIGAGIVGFWGTLLFWSALTSPEASFTSAEWVLFAVVCHVATSRSLGSREK